MKTSFVFEKKVRKSAAWLLIICIVLTIALEILAHAAMTGWYRVEVSNVWFENKNGLMVRGKLYRPEQASAENQLPGVVYLHGYQNNRETSDPYGIELGRRGFVVIVLDTLGRGNSDNQFSEDEPGFDPTYGGDSAFEYLRSLPYVDPERCGIGGHSLGGEMSFIAAMQNPNIKALVFSGFAYTEEATLNTPKNMLMIFGKYDEYRKRMTETRDFEKEWMDSPQTTNAIGVQNPGFNVTYGKFEDGTARRVHMTKTSHVGESFDKGALAEAVNWYNQSLNQGKALETPAESQIWRIKEITSLLAMLSGILSLLPLSVLLLGTHLFAELAGAPSSTYTCDKKTLRKAFWINFGLTQLFLALVMVIFGVHVYVVPIDKAFPMMMVNGVIFWFLVINLIGFLIFKRWIKKQRTITPDINYQTIGVSDFPAKIRLTGSKIWKTLLLGLLLFAFIYILQAGLEKLLLIDFRYKFPYASDLTSYRWLMLLLYFPLFLLGFIQVNIMLQAQLRRVSGKTCFRNILQQSLRGIAIMVLPLLFTMAVQYIPLYVSGLVPFVGPGGALVGFVINIEHMCVLLALMVPLSSLLYEATASIYPGAIINALIVTWMFTSSSVIAPLPV